MTKTQCARCGWAEVPKLLIEYKGADYCPNCWHTLRAEDKVTVRACARCGWAEVPSVLQVHHIRPRSWGGTDDESNLILLCPTCHVLEHRRNTPVNLNLGALCICGHTKGYHVGKDKSCFSCPCPRFTYNKPKE